MEAATYILLAIGILGATDILLFHTVSHGIRAHADSANELLVHSLRGPTYASLFVLVPNFAMEGAWFWLLMAIFVVDVAISLWDFVLEKHSRAVFGGLPTGEYILHIVLAMLFGAMVACVIQNAGHWAMRPTRIAYEPADIHWIIRAMLAVMAAFVLYIELGDLRAGLRHKWTKPFAGSAGR